MSREKECKCCHEWWYASVIKEDLCPNCYDYFKQLKQQLDESFTEEDVKGLIEDREKTIKFLQQQLAEKDKEIERLTQQALFPKYKYNTICYYHMNNEYIRAKYLAPISQKYSLIQDTKTNEIYVAETDWLKTKNSQKESKMAERLTIKNSDGTYSQPL